jgi:hypothetical protein
MEKTSLKFFKGASAPANLAAGMIWFDTSANVIKVYNGTAWEEFCGNIQVKDVKFEDLKLTVTNRNDKSFVLDFNDVASATETGANFAELKQRLSTIEGSISDTNDRIDALMANMPEGQKTIVSYVAAEIAKVDTDGAAEAVAGDLAEEIERATKKEAELLGKIEANEDAIEVLNGDAQTEGSVKKQVADAIATVVGGADESLDTLKEIAEWIADEGVAGKDAATLISKVNQAESDIDALQTAVTTTLPGAINTAVSEAIEGLDSEVVATASADVNKVNVLTKVVEADGKLTDKAEVELYSVAGVDAKVADAVKTAIEDLDGGYAASTEAEGKVAVVTGITQTDGKIVSGTQTEVYTSTKIDALLAGALGDNGSVATQITNALGELDLVSPEATVAKGGVSVIATVAQEGGQVSATAVEVEKAGAAAQALADAKADAANLYQLKGNYEAAGAAADAKAEVIGDAEDTKDDLTIYGVRKYADEIVAGKNVTAQGDEYVSASAEGNKVIVSANIDKLHEAILTWEEFA